MAHSVLQVPVPGLESFVRARTAYYDNDFLSSDPAFVHAHVTLLGPFRTRLDAATAGQVADIAACVEPFTFRLDRMAVFPDGIIHLRPDPDDRFGELTQRLQLAFPDCEPYDGQYPDSPPHLTLDLIHADVTTESTAHLLARHPRPELHRAERIDLAWYEPGACRVVRSWPLGGA